MTDGEREQAAAVKALQNSSPTPDEATLAMEAWKRRDAEHTAERDQLVRAAKAAGVNIRQIALSLGISRTTVYAILEATPA